MPDNRTTGRTDAHTTVYIYMLFIWRKKQGGGGGGRDKAKDEKISLTVLIMPVYCSGASFCSVKLNKET